MDTTSSQRYSRLTEAAGVVCLILGLLIWLSLISYHPEDPSWNTATKAQPKNWIGPAGAHIADLMLQSFGAVAFILPVLLAIVAWQWVRARHLENLKLRAFGALLFCLSTCVALHLGPKWLLLGAVPLGGALGAVLGEYAVAGLNLTGAALTAAACILISLYLATEFRLGHLAPAAALPAALGRPFRRRWSAWREARARRREEDLDEPVKAPARRGKSKQIDEPANSDTPPWIEPQPEVVSPARSQLDRAASQRTAEKAVEDIPIHTIEDLPPEPAPGPVLLEMPTRDPEPVRPAPRTHEIHAPEHKSFQRPSTDLLNEPQGRPAYDEDELKAIAARIKSKFEEFNVLGSVVQINPGPVVTTFEYKPEAGIKYTRITTLAEDLCLALQAESILIERIPGKPTVGIEVPNSRREIISLRQILESEEFAASPSRLSMALGKDISGRIKVAALESMPHLLIAGSTGSGKSVMLNTIIMSVLYKSTPDEVRMILVDPKRLEMGLYEGIPHLLTPVITDPKKATNALRNAVLEMERRLRLLASQGVRNIDQFNKKVRQLQDKPIALFEDMEEGAEDLTPLPHILILIDELADLMMIEGHNVELSVTRLAQMSRAVGMHLLLATQRPSVDVITGLIKANFPARISFRVATRVDSRTILDVMGADHLLGKGDMLFLPPGSSRLVRVHGAFVTESEINRVVDFWKAQAAPEYDRSFLSRHLPTMKSQQQMAKHLPMTRSLISGRSACCDRDGQGLDVNSPASFAPRLRPRRAHSGHDAARRHHRPP